jgi:fatty-acyl-CoA synthase
MSIYDEHLDRNAANHVPLTPLSFIARAATVFPDRPAYVHGALSRTWSEYFARCRRLCSALQRRGFVKGDTVSIMCSNIPAFLEAHYGVPASGAVLNSLNIRLDAAAIAFILDHSETKVLLTDTAFSAVIKAALAQATVKPLVIDIDDPVNTAGGERLGELEYEELLNEGDPDCPWELPADEWDAISLNYTSGTTGNPKGVVYHHRGAALTATGNVLAWGLPRHPVYLWTLPMFHCNGWCFPWTLPLVAGTHICLRQVAAKPIFDAIAEHDVTHLCGAPVVMNMLINAGPDERRSFDRTINMMTAASAPPAAVLARIEAMGFKITHVYGLTETYGPSVVCDWKEEWDSLPPDEQAAVKARQGVPYHLLDSLTVGDTATCEPLPADAASMGEVLFRGNVVMKGYLKNPKATAEAFAGGWFHSGDLGVMHPDGYIELKDRAKDIIISGGENISTLEVEGVLYRHPKILEAAVVGRPDEKWGETPCAFVTLKNGEDATAAEIIAFCRANLAHFKAPRTVVFGPLPKTSTGKVQKYVLRDQAGKLEN